MSEIRNGLACAVLLSQLCSSSLVLASSFFHPGDAYFSSFCEELKVEKLPNGRARLKLSYSTSDHTRVLNGFSGYRYLNIVGTERELNEFVGNIEKTRKAIRLVDPELYVLDRPGDFSSAGVVNPIRILVYNSNFNVSEHSLTLKFNENWPRYERIHGKRSEHADRNYEPLVRDYSAAIEDWKFAEVVEGLAIEGVSSESEWWTLKRDRSAELSINLASCKCYLFPRDEATAIYKQKKRICLYQVCDGSIQRAFWKTSSPGRKEIVFKRYPPLGDNGLEN